MSPTQPGEDIAQLYSTKTPGEAELEKQLGLMTAAIAECFAEMGKEDRTMFQELRRRESGIAVDLLRLSREFAVSMSKIRKRYQQAANLAHEISRDLAAAQKTA
ncbi:MAG TPA: hypothetical protein VG891_06085 [Rhizomicrobium sp.]|nr:hypothetical protein [Rhizomicrobium sp.]